MELKPKSWAVTKPCSEEMKAELKLMRLERKTMKTLVNHVKGVYPEAKGEICQSVKQRTSIIGVAWGL